MRSTRQGSGDRATAVHTLHTQLGRLVVFKVSSIAERTSSPPFFLPFPTPDIRDGSCGTPKIHCDWRERVRVTHIRSLRDF